MKPVFICCHCDNEDYYSIGYTPQEAFEQYNEKDDLSMSEAIFYKATPIEVDYSLTITEKKS